MKLKKIRNALLVVLTLALVSAATVAVTMALQKASIDAVENKFTNNPDIKVKFQEPTFDNLDWDHERTTDPNEGVPTGDAWPNGTQDTDKPQLPNGSRISSPDGLGYNLAQAYSPESYIPKNPQLRNSTNDSNESRFEGENKKQNGTTSDEWVALGVKYTLKIPTENVYLPADSGTNTGLEEAHPLASTKVDADHGNFLGYEVTFANYDDFKTAIAEVRKVPTGSTGTSADLDDTDTTAGHRTGTGAGFWTDISDSGKTGTLFIYNQKLSSQYDVGQDASKINHTNTLFDAVRINSFPDSGANAKRVWVNTSDLGVVQLYKLTLTGAGKAATGDGTYTFNNTVIYVTTLPEFTIQLTGYAIQGDELANVTAATAPMQAFVTSKNS